MSLHQFPPLAADAPPSVTLWQVRLLLGRTDHSDARFITYVQALVDELGFPRPFPSQPKGKPLTLAVTARSTFRRDAVEAWIADFLPPACARALDAAALQAAAQDLDAAALALGAGRLQLIEGGRP